MQDKSCLQARVELSGDISQLKDRLGLDEASVERLRHTAAAAQTELHGELAQVSTSMASEITQLRAALTHAQADMRDLSQRLEAERAQRSAEAAAWAARLAHAQQQADERIRCVLVLRSAWRWAGSVLRVPDCACAGLALFPTLDHAALPHQREMGGPHKGHGPTSASRY